MNKLKTGLLALTALGVISTATGVVHADSKAYQLRYFENYLANGNASDDDDDKYLYKIGYVNAKGQSKVVNKTAEHVDEYITDTNKTTVSNIGWGDTAEVIRPPYQTYEAGEKSSEVHTVGWTDFVKKHKGVKGKTLKVKWYENTNNSSIGSSENTNVAVIEFVYQGDLYRMYMPDGSNGLSNFKENVSPSVNTPTLSFDKDGEMTYNRAPYTSYVQSHKSGTVTEK